MLHTRKLTYSVFLILLLVNICTPISNGAVSQPEPNNWFGFTYPSQETNDINIWHTAIHKGEQWKFTVYRVPFLFSHYDSTKMDAIVNMIGEHGGKVVLDFHALNIYTTTPDLIGSPNWVSSWLSIVEHYKNSDIVIGYELANEPFTVSRYTGFTTNIAVADILTSTAQSIHSISPNKYIIFPPQNFIRITEYSQSLKGLNSVITIHPYSTGSKSTWADLKPIADAYFTTKLAGWSDKFDYCWMGEIEGHTSGAATTIELEQQYVTYCVDLSLQMGFGFCFWKYNRPTDDGGINQDTLLSNSNYSQYMINPETQTTTSSISTSTTLITSTTLTSTTTSISTQITSTTTPISTTTSISTSTLVSSSITTSTLTSSTEIPTEPKIKDNPADLIIPKINDLEGAKISSGATTPPQIITNVATSASIMVQIVPIFGVLMGVGAVSTGKINIKEFFGFIIAIVFVMLTSTII